MTRTPVRPVLAVATVLVAVVYVGCTSKTTPTPTTAAGSKVSSDAPAAKPTPASKLFANWPKPLAALIISGQMDGYLEPCGCAAGQYGGLGRRFDLIEKLKAQGWPLAMVDLGSLIANPASARGGLDQTKVKFNVALRALTAMDYSAVALSPDDLKLGVDETLGRYLNMNGGPKLLAANLAPQAPYDELIKKSVVRVAGPIKVGVTTVIDPETLAALADTNKDQIPASQPREVLPAILEDLEKTSDVQVLLVQGPAALAKSLATSYPGFDVVVATSIHDEPPDQPELLNGGKTMLVSVGTKGKFVGAVGIFADPANRFRYQRVSLNDRYQQADSMRKLIDEDYVNELKDLRIVEDFVRRGNVRGAPGSTYVGAQACQECHPNAYAKWSSSKHAQAFDDLLKDKHRPNRNFDAECISCHTTGFEYNGGWVSAEKTPNLRGNQCENCHGPASKHAEAPDDASFRKALALSAASANRDGLCLQCHDSDNSPHFNFELYYPKIMHKGLDTYADPKVHRGGEKVAGRPAP